LTAPGEPPVVLTRAGGALTRAGGALTVPVTPRVVVTVCGAENSEAMPRISSSSTQPQSSIRAVKRTRRLTALLPSRTAGASSSREVFALLKRLIVRR